MITESYLSLVLDPRSEPHFPVLSPLEQLGCLWLQCRLPVCVHRSKSPSWPQGDISPSAHCEPFQVTAQDPLSDPEMKNSTLVTQSKGPAHRCGSASTKPPNEKNILFYPSLPWHSKCIKVAWNSCFAGGGFGEWLLLLKSWVLNSSWQYSIG